MTVELVFFYNRNKTDVLLFHAFVTSRCAYQSIENKHMCDNKSEPRLTGREKQKKQPPVIRDNVDSSARNVE